MALVYQKGLAGEQMHRDRVAVEGVEGQEIKVLRGLVLQGQSGIAQNNAHLAGRLLEVGKMSLGEPGHVGIDLVKADLVAGLGIGGEGSSSKPDDSDMASTGWQGCESPAHSAFGAIIKGGRGGTGGSQE